MSQGKLGSLVGAGQGAVSSWEVGRTFPTDLSLIARIAEVLDPDCAERLELRLLHAAGAVRDCALRTGSDEHLLVEQVFGGNVVEWTDRLAKAVAKEVASELTEALEKQQQVFLQAVAQAMAQAVAHAVVEALKAARQADDD